jgi:hypothetical protein
MLVSVAIPTKSALADPPPDDAAAKRPPASAASVAENAGDEVQYGLGVRLRSVWVPKSILQLFVERAAGGAHNYGIGADLTRRRGTSELQLGFEYEHINIGQGVYINKGDDVSAGDEADYVLGPQDSGHQFAWFTIEFTFLNHAEITSWLAVRYGGGIGVGILRGEIDHYNVVCNGATNANPEPGCVPPRYPQGQGSYSPDPGGPTAVPYKLPPVFPVVNAILGLEIKPNNHMTINLEGGIRTLPFAGVSTAVFF